MWTTMKNNILGKQFLSCSFYLYRFREYVSNGFPIINFCNLGVHYETPCIIWRKWLRERASVLRYMYVSWLVSTSGYEARLSKQQIFLRCLIQIILYDVGKVSCQPAMRWCHFRCVRVIRKKPPLVFLFMPPVPPSVHLSVCLHVSARLLLDGFPLNLILENFIKICRETPNSVKFGQKFGASFIKT